MSKLNSNNILFNVAGIGIVVTAIGYMGYTFFITEKVPHCTARFPAGQQFAFESAKGKPLTTIELQARAGLREWGVLQNAKIANGSGVPAGGVMEVSLAATGDEDKADQNGVGFVWPVNELAKAGAACLSYQVFFPGSFKFAEPGYLPGLFGAGDLTQLDESKPSDGFAARVGWDQNGEIGVEVRSPASAGFWQSSTRRSRWPTGQWVSVEQELAMNTPEKANGTMRMWINGNLTVENYAINLRATPQSNLSGVLSEIGYARTASEVATLKVSPFIIQWQ